MEKNAAQLSTVPRRRQHCGPDGSTPRLPGAEDWTFAPLLAFPSRPGICCRRSSKVPPTNNPGSARDPGPRSQN